MPRLDNATPAPWQAARDCGAYGDAGAAAVYDSGGRKLALVFANEVSTERAAANAQLMAAAPELRDALRALAEYAADCAAERDERPPCVAAARALLARLEP